MPKFTLRYCARQLASLFTDISIWLLRLCKVPAIFKRAVVIAVPKKSNVIGLNYYRPVSLTLVMNMFA